MKRIAGAILLILFSQIVIGQSVRDTIQIKEINVYGQRRIEDTGLKITRPDSLAMVSSLTSNLSELLAQHTPVFIKSYGRGSSATASFRGTSASHTQLVWNGMTLNSPMRGYADLSLLPVMFVDHAWLLHGGSSLAENSGALGGSIHLANVADWGQNNSIVAMMERGSFNSGTYLAKIQAGKGNFRSVTRLMYDHSDNTFPFYNVGVLPYRTDTLRNADFLKWAILQEFYLRYKVDNQISARVWYQQSQRNLPQLMSFEGSLRKEFQNDQQFRSIFEVKNYASVVKFHYISGLNHTRLKYFRSAPEIGFVNDDSQSSETSLNNRIKIMGNIRSALYFNASIDANFHRVNVSNAVREIGYLKDRIELGSMVNVQYKPGNNWGTFLLLRSEWYGNQFIPLIPSVGADVLITDSYNLLLKANFARNYHKPSLNDLYWVPGGNPDLIAEDGITGDVSISSESGISGLWHQELSFFYSRIDNWIMWQPASSGAWYWEAANVKDVLSRGVEYNFSGRVNVREFKVQFSGNYAYTRSTNENAMSSVDKSRGKQLIYIPKHTGNLHGTATFVSWTFKTSLNYTGRRYTQSSNEWSHFESVLNPFWLTGAALEKKFETGNWNISAQIKADNLLNINYQQILWRPMPGRHYSVTLSFRWKS
jgi:iron complex outermembrane receptor protein